METKRRTSLDDLNSLSGLRRFTRSPTHHRLSLRRLSISSSSSASVTSVVSTDTETPLSCVARDLARDDCALHRFIVWAAVKRNISPKISPDDKNRCPLTECRQICPSHELMLQHLYTCDKLADGRYWCPDCSRTERIHDDKCRRCLGHPSKRRKIMTLAKNFFSSLGQRSRGGTSLADEDGDLDDDDQARTSWPKFDFQDEHFEAELHSNEVFEIGSSDIGLPTILEIAEPDAELKSTFEQLPAILPRQYFTSPLAPVPRKPAELESSGLILDDELLNLSGFDPAHVVAPEDLVKRANSRSPDKPVLQLYTQDLEQIRRNAKRQYKMLAPSSSVRSTASTMSTNSTVSTASCSISPMSGWSGAWGKGTGFDSTMTSPADDLFSPADMLPCDMPMSSVYSNTCDDSFMDMGFTEKYHFLSELPADMPALPVIPEFGCNEEVYTLTSSSMSFGPSASTQSTANSLAVSGQSSLQPEPELLAYENPLERLGSAKDLAQSAHSALELHILSSMGRLLDLKSNQVASRFLALAPSEILSAGLAALTGILAGNQSSCSLQLLCFIHLVYSFSLVVHQDDVAQRTAHLFAQALSYRSWLPRDDVKSYIQVVRLLWEPVQTGPGSYKDIIRIHGRSIRNSKGKQAEMSDKNSSDALVVVSQYFLDEIEFLALRESNNPVIQASDLSIQHMKDVNSPARKDTPFLLAVQYLLDFLAQRYNDNDNFCSSITRLRNRVIGNQISTARRLELELVHEGRRHLSSDVFFDEYISLVRRQVDELYRQPDLGFTSRATYQNHGIRFIDTMPLSQWGKTVESNNNDANGLHLSVGHDSSTLDAALDEMLGSLEPDGVFELDPMPPAAAAAGQGMHQVQPDRGVHLTAMRDHTPHQPVSQGAAPSPRELDRRPTSTEPRPETLFANPSPGPVGSDSSPSSSVASNSCCEICGYRPKGDPRWFSGSMAKHKRLQHASGPAKIYRCPYPGCKSEFSKRPDNLKKHQIDRGHFVDGEAGRPPSKKRRVQ